VSNRSCVTEEIVAYAKERLINDDNEETEEENTEKKSGAVADLTNAAIKFILLSSRHRLQVCGLLFDRIMILSSNSTL
jgi:hypothetical protein